jgi:hypothetical protein
MDHDLCDDICDEVSIEHADGSTECLDQDCTLPHELHQWHAGCSAIVPPCGCAPAEQPQPSRVLAEAA